VEHKKEIFFILWQISIIAVFNWLYNSIAGKEITEQYNLISFLFITIAVGIFPTLFYTINAEKILSHKHGLIANELSENLRTSKFDAKTELINIVAENNTNLLILNLPELICIVSEGNYVNVFYYENDKINKKLIRNSLSNIKRQLIVFGSIQCCHRSYIINLQNVSSVSGNARNYNLHVKNLGFTVPVSRNFPKTIIKNILKTQNT